MTPNSMDEVLFKQYQADTLLEKVILLKAIIDSPNSHIELLEQNGTDRITDRSAFINGLKAEVHYTIFHSLENLLALAIAIIHQPDNVWKWLRGYGFREFH